MDYKIDIQALASYIRRHDVAYQDNKGYYISVMDEKNNTIVEEYYSENDNEDYLNVEHKLDINKIIDYIN